jgi:hypothetical protein
MFYDDYHKAFLYYTGRSISWAIIDGSTTGSYWYPELKEMDNVAA